MTLIVLALRRVLSSKFVLILLIAVPAGIVVFGAGDLGIGLTVVGFVDEDDSEVSRALRERVEEAATVATLDRERIANALFTGDVSVAFAVPGGFDAAVRAGGAPDIEMYTLQEEGASGVARFYAESFVLGVRNIAANVDDEADFDRALAAYRDPQVRLAARNREPEGPLDAGTTARLRVASGFLVLVMLFVAEAGSIVMLKDRENGALARILSGPTTMRRYMFGYLVAYLCVFAVQVVLTVITSAAVYGTPLALSLRYGAVLLAFSVVAVALAVALAGVSKNVYQLSTVSAFIVLPMAMLGGTMWPVEIMPPFLQSVSRLLPTTWANSAVSKIVTGATLTSAATELALLGAFALVFFLLGSWRARDVALRGGRT